MALGIYDAMEERRTGRHISCYFTDIQILSVLCKLV